MIFFRDGCSEGCGEVGMFDSTLYSIIITYIDGQSEEGSIKENPSAQ